MLLIRIHKPVPSLAKEQRHRSYSREYAVICIWRPLPLNWVKNIFFRLLNMFNEWPGQNQFSKDHALPCFGVMSEIIAAVWTIKARQVYTSSTLHPTIAARARSICSCEICLLRRGHRCSKRNLPLSTI